VPDLGFLNGPIGAALLAIASALTVAILNRRTQLDQDELRDARTLRDKKRERLAASYEAVLLAAITVKDILARRKVLLEGETDRSRAEMLRSALDKTLRELGHARVRLLLETDQKDVVSLFDRAYATFTGALAADALRQRDRTGAVNPRAVEMHEFQLAELVDQLELALRTALAKQEQPIRALGPTSRRLCLRWPWPLRRESQ